MAKKEKSKNRLFLIVGFLLFMSGVSLYCGNKLSEYITTKKEQKAMEEIISKRGEATINEVDLDEVFEEKTESESNTPADYSYVGVLEIPKIKLKRGFLSIDDINNNVNKNIQVINGSDMPDVVNGNLMIAGHSGSGQISYFKNLHKAVKNDKAIVYYNNNKYVYKLDNTYEVDKTGYAKIIRSSYETTLSLITCSQTDKTKQIVFIFYLEEMEEL